MVQTKKQLIHDRIIRIALEEFAINGYNGTRISVIARKADIATGNIYHYFRSKDELFSEVLPEDFLRRLTTTACSKITALRGISDIETLDPAAEFHIRAAEFLEYIIDNRLRLIIIIRGLENSPHQNFKHEFSDRIYNEAVSYYRSLNPDFSLSEIQQYNLQITYKNFFQSIADLLLHFADKDALRSALITQIRYHQGGLHHIFTDLL